MRLLPSTLAPGQIENWQTDKRYSIKICFFEPSRMTNKRPNHPMCMSYVKVTYNYPPVRICISHSRQLKVTWGILGRVEH